MYILACTSIVLSNSVNHEKAVKIFYEELHKIDTELQLSNKLHSSLKNKLKLEIWIILCLNFTFQVVDLTLFINVNVLQYYIGGYIIHNFLLVALLQIKFEAEILLNCLKLVNENLLGSDTPAVASTDNLPTQDVNFRAKAKNASRLYLLHKKLCNLIEILSNVRGIQIILLIISIIGLILNCLITVFIHGLKFNDKRLIGGRGYAIYCDQLFTALMHIMLLIMLIRQCSTVSKESFKTASLAKDMLLEVSMENDSDALSFYEQQLKILTMQVFCRNSTYSAAGYFAINYSIIFTIMGVVLTYFIIIIQFYE